MSDKLTVGQREQLKAAVEQGICSQSNRVLIDTDLLKAVDIAYARLTAENAALVGALEKAEVLAQEHDRKSQVLNNSMASNFAIRLLDITRSALERSDE